MKRSILSFLAVVAAISTQAQNINPENDRVVVTNETPTAKKCNTCDLSGWVIDLNFMCGGLNQQLSSNDPIAAYTEPVNSKVSGIQFNNGMSHGIELQAGYFFGKKRNWGIGLGVSHFRQTGNVTMDEFHAEYASYDNFGNVFRQIVTANDQIKERVCVSSINIPIVAKYQTKLSKKVGFTADAGILFNVKTENHYKTNASFDYEAIYKYVGTTGSIQTVYDNSTPPGPSDLLITKSQYLANNPSGDIQNYFNSVQAQGYNVGLGVTPAQRRGEVSYTSGSVGFILRPAISVALCNNFALNLGLYYYHQEINNTAASNYHITDKVGSYSSVLNTVTNAVNNSYGINVGLRYTFCKKKAEVVPEPTPEPEPEVVVATPVEVEPQEETRVDISTPVLFDLDKVVIKESSLPILDEAVKQLKADPSAKLTINGYTDNTGNPNYNKKLSKKRAIVVKNYLRDHGVDPKILKAVGHGSKNPAASNKTPEGRMKNRRVIMEKDLDE